MFTVETKSMLAKLMATENIKVEHRNTKTARFNLESRTLTCPIWKDMTGDIYDLLMGHEISHALNTPAVGWHDSITYAGGNKKASTKEQKAFKHFLNVVEDARIEKIVKRRYPGLKRPMVNAYRELLARDMFGLKGLQDFNKLYLIDKLNLAAKCGTLLNIHFTSEEKPYYDAIMATETWEEVVKLATKLYEYSKKEQQKGEKEKQEIAEKIRSQYQEEEEENEWVEGEEGDDFEYDEEYNEEGDEEEEDRSGSRGSKEESDEEESEKDSEEGEGDSDSDSDSDEEKEQEGKDGKGKGEKTDKKEKEKKADDKTVEEKADKGEGKRAEKNSPSKKQNNSGSTGEGAAPSEPTQGEEFVPKAKTDESFREQEEKMVEDDKTESFYCNIPTPNLKDIVTPTAIVNKGLTKEYTKTVESRRLAVQLYNDFRKKNADYIGLLAKEFEMRKAARSYQKAKISDSGDINVNKLANYRMEDDIFKKMMVVQKGKSHGLVLIVDKSGSMHEHIDGAIEQIIILALFCRKVNIPFVAYSFTDSNGRAHEHDFGNRQLKQFSTNKNDLWMHDLDLREMFNSRMSAGDFSQAIMNHLMLAKSLARSYNNPFPAPPHEGMGGTPLNEALVALRDVIREFKMKHRLDIVNAVVVHDGDSNGNSFFYKQDMGSRMEYGWSGSRNSFNEMSNRVTLVDAKDRVNVPVPRDHRGVTQAIMKWLQLTTGCGIFGFYITGNTVRKVRSGLVGLYHTKQGIKLADDRSPETTILIDKLCREVLDEKFVESYTTGYTRFYFIPGSEELKAEEGVLINNGKAWTPSRLLSAFKKVNRKKQTSRVLVSRFIELIAHASK